MMWRATTGRRPRWWWAGLVALVALMPVLPGLAASLGTSDATMAVPGEVLVTLADGSAPAVTPADLPAAIQPLVARFAIERVTPLGRTTTYRLQSALGADSVTMAAAFAGLPVVVAAEPNWRVLPAQTPANDPLYAGGNQWHLVAVNAASAWAITTGSPEVLVAVVNSGIDRGQVDLVGKVVGGYDFVEESFDIIDGVGHGTSVASFITSNTNDGKGLAGLAPGVRLLSFRALTEVGGSSFDVARGVIAGADAGARVINLSLGGGSPSLAIAAAIGYAYRKGVVVVAASGNGGTAVPHYPAADRFVIAVGASNRQNQIVDFSQRGPHVAVVAPGAGVLGAVAGGDQSVTNGTSFSSPIVSGIVALMLSANPALTPDEVKLILEGTATDLGAEGFDVAAGWGLVDAGRAVVAARDRTPLPNRQAVIQGHVRGADPATVLISVDPFGQVVRPTAGGFYQLSDRGRATYTLRATTTGGVGSGPVAVSTTGQAGEVHTVDFNLTP